MRTFNKPSETTIDTANQLHRSALRLLRVLRGTRPAKGVSLSKLAILGRLYQDGMATTTALAAYLRVQPQSLTRLVAELERRKLITRRQNNADRRQGLLEITDAGTRLLTGEVGVQRLKLAHTMANELTATEQEMLRLAAGLMDRLSSVTEARPFDLGEPEQNKAQRAASRKRRPSGGTKAEKKVDP